MILGFDFLGFQAIKYFPTKNRIFLHVMQSTITKNSFLLVFYSYVLVFYPYVTGMYLVCTRMLLVCTCMLLVCRDAGTRKGPGGQNLLKGTDKILIMLKSIPWNLEGQLHSYCAKFLPIIFLA